MVNRQRIALAVVGALSLIPMTAQAGAGGTPIAPAAGTSTNYCCQRWREVEARTADGGTFTFLNGQFCQVISDSPFDRNSCSGEVVKCRGETFKPGQGGSVQTLTGTVDRCLNP